MVDDNDWYVNNGNNNYNKENHDYINDNNNKMQQNIVTIMTKEQKQTNKPEVPLQGRSSADISRN